MLRLRVQEGPSKFQQFTMSFDRANISYAVVERKTGTRKPPKPAAKCATKATKKGGKKKKRKKTKNKKESLFQLRDYIKLHFNGE